MNHEALSNRGMLQGVASSPTTLTYSRRNLRHPECNTTSSVLLYRLAQIPVFTNSRGRSSCTLIKGVRQICISRLQLQEEDLMAHFEDATSFVHEARVRGRPVLVHCVQGQSRSPTFILAYALRFLKLSLSAALKV